VSGSIGEPGDRVTFRASFEGECFTASAEGDWIDPQQIEQCVGDVAATDQLDEVLNEAPAVAEFLTALQEAFADVEPVGLEVRQVEGAWFVSPVSTWTEAMLSVLGALDRQELDRLLELGTAGAAEFFDLALGGMFGVDDSFDDSFDDPDESFDDAYDDAYDDLSDDTAVSADAGSQAADTGEAATWDECYNEREAADASACFQQFVDIGEIDASYIPVVLRFPECGYADLSWSGDLYSMGDAEFVAAADAARPCFVALLEAETVEEYELPYEMTKPECFEGRNWYATFDDEAYDARFQACVSGQPPASSVPTATAAPPATTVAG
jgi:hypothetical protein